jgi:hypothetical protein
MVYDRLIVFDRHCYLQPEPALTCGHDCHIVQRVTTWFLTQKLRLASYLLLTVAACLNISCYIHKSDCYALRFAHGKRRKGDSLTLDHSTRCDANAQTR